ncbi:TetR/AcrR family transcriptional regulator [Rubrobacter marinus]|nr:TetR family transcriptional regulator C-terminal domain-containing protein [Rubrobacter marinus]
MVDADARRTELAEAAWRVILRDGLERASVRNVAREAGLSMGSLRHYFGSQTELLAFAMGLVTERARRRVRALDLASCGPRQAAESMLSEVLPLDAERRAEAEVWLALTGKALVDPILRALRDEAYDGLRELCERSVRALVESDGAVPGLDVDLETERLYAVIDGLTVHAVIRPDLASTETVKAVLARHLAGLCRRA